MKGVEWPPYGSQCCGGNVIRETMNHTVLIVPLRIRF